MSIPIRPAFLADAPLLADWAKAMAFETERKILADDDISPGVRRAIEQVGLARYFIAELDGRPIGRALARLQRRTLGGGVIRRLQQRPVVVDPKRLCQTGMPPTRRLPRLVCPCTGFS